MGIWELGVVIDISVTRVRRLTVKRDLIGWLEAIEAEAARARKAKRYFIGLVLSRDCGNETWAGG